MAETSTRPQLEAIMTSQPLVAGRRARRTSQQENNPLRQSALVSKDEIQAFGHPTSAVRTSLATTMWLRASLEGLPSDHPNHIYYQALLEREPTTPCLSSSSSITSYQPSLATPKSSPTFNDLTPDVSGKIAESTIQVDHIFTSRTRSAESDCLSSEEHFEAGCQASDLVAMLPKSYRSQGFQFDLCNKDGATAFFKWAERGDQVSSAKTIRLLHLTFYWSSKHHCWSYVTDSTDISLTRTGRIKLKRASEQLQLDRNSCTCSMAELVGWERLQWKSGEIRSLMDFVEALRQEKDPLVNAVTKVIDLVEEHDEKFNSSKSGPKACAGCGKRIIYLRMDEDVQW